MALDVIFLLKGIFLLIAAHCSAQRLHSKPNSIYKPMIILIPDMPKCVPGMHKIS